MTSSQTPDPRYSRRILWLAVFVAVLFGGYSAAWFHFAGRLEAQAKALLAEANANGMSVDCERPTARGFPFRIGLYCDAVRFDDRRGTAVSAGALRSAAQFYNPFHIVGELDGPSTVAVPRFGTFALDWSELRASVRLATPLPERVSVEGAGLTAGVAAGPPLASAQAFQGHFRPNGADLDLAGSVVDFVPAASLLQGRALPPLSGAFDATVKDGVRLLGTGASGLRGQSGTIRQLSVSTDAATGVDLKGTFAVDQQGIIDADLSITLRNPKGLAEVAAKAAPEAKDKIDQAMMGIGMLGANPSLPLKIRKGKAMLGFIPLGSVPALD